jgi:MFS family permease
MILIATPFISRALAYKYFERLVRRVGVKAILLPSMFYISITPSLWAFFPTVPMIALFQLLSGIAWTGFEYGILIKQLADFSQAERSRVLTWTNLIVGIFNIVGVSIGSQMLGKNPTALDYNHLFELSSVMRFVPILVVFAIDWKVSARYIKKFYFRFLGARVNRGGVTRPILYVDENGEK